MFDRKPEPTDERYADFVRLTDADTLVVDIRESPEIVTRDRVRLVGLNAPPLDTAEGKAAADWVREWLSRHQAVDAGWRGVPGGLLIRRTRPEREKYGRWLAEVWARDGACLNADLIASGHAAPWDGVGPRPLGMTKAPDAAPGVGPGEDGR